MTVAGVGGTRTVVVVVVEEAEEGRKVALWYTTEERHVARSYWRAEDWCLDDSADLR